MVTPTFQIVFIDEPKVKNDYQTLCNQRNQQGDSTMYISKLKLKEEEIEDRGDASQKNRRRWRLNGYREDDSKIWSKILVDEWNQPLYDYSGTYIPRQMRNKIRNEKEIYYRKNPHKSVWKTEVNKTDYEIIEEKKNITSLRRIL